MGKKSRKDRGDHYYRLAKKEDYRSRASFKLSQLNQRYQLIKNGDVVVDLGAAPGGWLQVAREEVGENGFVLGVDIQKIAVLPHENVKTLVADITDIKTPELIRSVLPRRADVVVSDAAPHITGVWDVDHARSIDLAKSAFALARNLLKPGGNLLIKVFQGEFFEDFLKEIRTSFEFTKISKPQASRKGSAEVYVIGQGHKLK